MVKKRGKKRTIKKRAVRKSRRRIILKSGISGRSVRFVRSSSRKIKVVSANLIVFVILSVLSYILSGISSKLIYENLFFLLAFLLGGVSLALFIALLVLLVLKGMKK